MVPSISTSRYDQKNHSKRDINMKKLEKLVIAWVRIVVCQPCELSAKQLYTRIK